MPNYPTSLPASDVYSWAKDSSKPTYTKSEIGLGNVDNTADSQKSVNYANSAGYASSAGSAQPVFNNGTWYTVGDDVEIGDHNVGGGLGIKGHNANTRLDFCQYGDESNYKSITFDGSTLYMNGNCDYASSAGYANSAGSAPANGGNSSTVNGHTVNSDVPAGAVFTDTNTWRPISDSVESTSSDTSASSKAVKTAYDLAASKTSNTGTVTSVAAGTGLSGGTITTSGTLSVAYGTTAGTACQGNDSRLSDARPASDVYSWAKASSKPSYSYSEISGTPSSLPASDVYSWAKASTKPTYNTNEVMNIWAEAIYENTSSSCSITGNINAGKAETRIYYNDTNSELTVTVPTTYETPDGEAIELTCPVGGYCEVSYLNFYGVIYARGL